MTYKVFLLLFVLSVGLFACDSGPDAPRGFSLPKGDVAKGEAVFKKYQCLGCHTLKGVEDPSIQREFEQPVQLGGDTTLVKTYAQLVTSIINPSHKIVPRAIKLESVVKEDGTSKMRIYNDVMTVSELIDIVAFLQPKYEVKPQQYTHYNTYHIP